MVQLSLTRIYGVRACYLLLFVGLSVQTVPELLGPIVAAPLMEGAVTAMLGALGVLSILGLFAPLRMLPLLLFEMTWKLIWTLSVALPKWRAGTLGEDFIEMIFACAFVVPFFFIFPWRYAAAQYRASLDPWLPLKRPLT